MKHDRLPTRDVRENRAEREEKLGQVAETLPGKTLRDRTPFSRTARERDRGRRQLPVQQLPQTIIVQRPVDRNQGVVFSVRAPEASWVSVAGTFNDWNPHATPLVKGANGDWWVEKELAPGEYQYRFVVDGIWQDDPTAKQAVENPFGTLNSVVCVK